MSLDFNHDPTQAGVLVFSVLVIGGLLVSLFVPRRRLWVMVAETEQGVRLQYAGLARGDDPQLEDAVTAFADAHAAASPAPSAAPSSQQPAPTMES